MPVRMPGAGGREEQRLGGSMWEEAECQVRQRLVGVVRMTACILSGGGGAPEVDATRPVLARAPPGGRVQNTLSGARVKPRRVERHSNSLSPEKGYEKWSILDLFGR